MPDSLRDPKDILLDAVEIRVCDDYPNPSHAGAFGTIEYIIDGWFIVHLKGDPARSLLRLHYHEFRVLNCGPAVAS